MLERQAIDLSRCSNKLMHAAVAFNTECTRNATKIVCSTMFAVTFRTMLLMSSQKIRRLMSIVVTEIRITDKKVASPIVASKAFLIRSRSGFCVTTERNNAIQRAGERDMANFTSILKHTMRR